MSEMHKNPPFFLEKDTRFVGGGMEPLLLT